jgi:hypothetical protein
VFCVSIRRCFVSACGLQPVAFSAMTMELFPLRVPLHVLGQVLGRDQPLGIDMVAGMVLRGSVMARAAVGASALCHDGPFRRRASIARRLKMTYGSSWRPNASWAILVRFCGGVGDHAEPGSWATLWCLRAHPGRSARRRMTAAVQTARSWLLCITWSPR